MKRILVVEDEPTIAAGLEEDLKIEGYAVDVVDDGCVAESQAASGAYDLILLDIMLPGKDGLSVCRSLRAEGVRTPVLLLTAKGQEIDKVLGLELGADDYVTKPFSPRELLARIKAVMRRFDESQAPRDVVMLEDLKVDFRRFEVTRNAVPVPLTPTEFRILRAFVEHKGEVLSLRRLKELVWSGDTHVTERVVYTHMNNLRGKIERDAANPRLLVSVHGIGYRLDA
jgi:DNA-binding response OmpR family regulator